MMDASRREFVADTGIPRGGAASRVGGRGRGRGFRRAGLLLLLGLAGWSCPSGNGVVVVPPPPDVPESTGPEMMSAAVSASAWPEADSLFRKEPAWLGGDIASTVDLGGDRTLWLFGDSFIATSDSMIRTEAAVVRNTIALQTGRDPSNASIDFFWRRGRAGPRAFIRDEGEAWFWPLHGVRQGDSLTLFYRRMAPQRGGSAGAAEAVGWIALRIGGLDAALPEWDPAEVGTFESGFPVVVGVSVLVHDGHVYAYAVEDPGDHDAYLVRWTEEAFTAGNLAAAQWWNGPSAGWVDPTALTGPPAPVFTGAQTEFSVSWSEEVRGFVEVQDGLGTAATVAARFSPTPEGPWSELKDVFRPPESDQAGLLVYGAKAHAELTGAHLLATYLADSQDFTTSLMDSSLLYPRFVRLTFGSAGPVAEGASPEAAGPAPGSP